MRCSECGAENPSGKRFCGDCGTPLANLCPKCGADNPAGKRFCGDCGAALEPASAPQRKSDDSQIHVASASVPETSEGERKTVTALFADIKGSTELELELDPEEARALVDPALRLMIDSVQRYDGYVVQSTGDGIFAIFGAPIAHEDHPQRALYAALRMQEELRRYSTELVADGGDPLEARIGASTGEVVVRSISTGKDHVEYTPIGHTANLASRMQVVAPTGSVAIGEDTRKLVEGYFMLKPLGPTRVKGVAEPVNVYEVTGLGPLRTRLQRAAGRGLTKFVGREREMEALKHAAGLATGGHGQIVAAVAQAGVGKSRLFYEFKAVSQSDWMVLETFSVSHGKASAYLPLIDLLRGYFDIRSEDEPRKRREKATGRVVALDRSLEDTLPYLFSLLGIVEGNDPLAQMGREVKQRRTLDAIKRILLRESLNQPLMVIFEDLHWIDEHTQEFLNLLADSIGTARILLLVNYRPEYSHQWGSKTYYTQLRLDPLGKESAEEMLAALLGSSPLARSIAGEGKSGEQPGAGEGADLTQLKQLIIERTEGTPFFMEEIVQALFEDGTLQRNGAVRLIRPISAMKVPATVQGVLAARIDRLPADTKDLLQTLAVLGREFPLSLVRAIVPEGGLERRLHDLQLGEFIYEQPAVGDTEYIFKHALTQEVAYNSVLTERRRAIHDRAGRAIEELYAGRLEDNLSELAHQYLRGSNTAKAVHYAQLAADQAASRGAYGEADGLLEAALKLLAKLPGSPERQRSELALRVTQGAVAFVLHGPTSREREAALKRACELGEELGEPDQLLRGLVGLSSLCFGQGESVRGFELTTRSLELAEGQDVGLLPDIFLIRGGSAWSSGKLREATANLKESLRAAERTKRSMSQLGFLFRIGFANWQSQALQLLGLVGEATKIVEECLSYARDSGHLFSLGVALNMEATLGFYRREPERARVHAEQGIALSEQSGFPFWLAIGRIFHGWALAELGQLEQGLVEMEAGVRDYHGPQQQFLAATLAYERAKVGRIEEALATLDENLAHIERTGERMGQAEMLRFKGEMLLMRDRAMTPEAEDCFRAALGVAREQEAKWWELRATVSLARLLRDSNRRDEARTMLTDIYNWFTEGFDLPDLKDAKALLDNLA